MDFTEKFINRILKLSQKSNHNRKRKFPNEELNWFRARPFEFYQFFKSTFLIKRGASHPLMLFLQINFIESFKSVLKKVQKA
jgi:hypothetical protein